MSNKIWDLQNHILDLSIFSVYGHGARFSKQIFLVMAKHVCKKNKKQEETIKSQWRHNDEKTDHGTFLDPLKG